MSAELLKVTIKEVTWSLDGYNVYYYCSADDKLRSTVVGDTLLHDEERLIKHISRDLKRQLQAENIREYMKSLAGCHFYLKDEHGAFVYEDHVNVEKNWTPEDILRREG